MAVSLRDLRHHTGELDRLVTTAWMSDDKVATLDHSVVRKHMAEITALLDAGEAAPAAATKDKAATAPHAATAARSPKAATDADKKTATAKEKAAYARAAADKAPDLSAILGLGHIRKG
ncbi:MAG: hypothetical protein ACREXP_14705 [Steroidobacteraceae bacterium]